MEKSIITLGFLFFMTGTIMGQTAEPKPGYAGISNEAIIDQIGNNNIGNIGQFGSNTATIDQVGDNNRALVQQGTGELFVSGGDMSLDNPLPDGSGNIQSSSSAVLIQNGDLNDAFVAQLGVHSAEINQKGTDNQAAIVQVGIEVGLPFGVGDAATGSFASIIQKGSYNEATVGQYGNSHDGDIEQYGNNNRAAIAQLSGLGGYYREFYPRIGGSKGGSTGTIIQHGDWNEATIIQNGENAPTKIVQYGYESTVKVEHN